MKAKAKAAKFPDPEEEEEEEEKTTESHLEDAGSCDDDWLTEPALEIRSFRSKTTESPSKKARVELVTPYRGIPFSILHQTDNYCYLFSKVIPDVEIRIKVEKYQFKLGHFMKLPSGDFLQSIPSFDSDSWIASHIDLKERNIWAHDSVIGVKREMETNMKLISVVSTDAWKVVIVPWHTIALDDGKDYF